MMAPTEEPIIRSTEKMPRGSRVLRVYPAKDGFRWRLRYNDKVLSDGGEAYGERHAAKKAALQNGVPAGEFPVFIEYEKYVANKLVWVRERIR